MLMLAEGSGAETNGAFTPEEQIRALLAEGEAEAVNYSAESQAQIEALLRMGDVSNLTATAASNTTLPKNCSANIQGTNYYTPKSSDFQCAPANEVKMLLPNGRSKQLCPRAVVEAGMQGSIIVVEGNERFLLRSDGVIYQMPQDRFSGSSCKMTSGGAGTCLIPYIDVAADKNFYSYGDIIEVPALKGVSVPSPSGGFMTHPGFVRVSDTGGAIKGANRFDFYIGNMKHLSNENPLGPRGLQLNQKDNCVYSYRKVATGTAEWNTASSSITNVVQLGTARLADYHRGQQ